MLLNFLLLLLSFLHWTRHLPPTPMLPVHSPLYIIVFTLLFFVLETLCYNLIYILLSYRFVYKSYMIEKFMYIFFTWAIFKICIFWSNYYSIITSNLRVTFDNFGWIMIRRLFYYHDLNLFFKFLLIYKLFKSCHFNVFRYGSPIGKALDKQWFNYAILCIISCLKCIPID